MSAAEDVRVDALSAVSSTVTNVHQLMPTRLTDTSLPHLLLSPTYTSAQSQRVRHSASDTAAQLLTTPSSYRASFSRLQLVDIPDVDHCRHGNVVSHRSDYTVPETHKRSHFLVVLHSANASHDQSTIVHYLIVQIILYSLSYTFTFCLLDIDIKFKHVASLRRLGTTKILVEPGGALVLN